MTDRSEINNNKPVIKCDSVYKIFGNNAKKLLENSEGQVDAKNFSRSRMHCWRKQCFF